MRHEDITHVFCLSCVLMIFCASSQPSCPSGWFGKEYKYKCRCTNTSCDVNGSCVEPFVCEGGWFGPACQYADIAYEEGNFTEITDGNDTTCITANSGNTIHIPFNGLYVFTWLRIYFSDQGSDGVSNLAVIFTSNTTLVPCPKMRHQAVSKTILDMHCDLSETIDAITLTGQAVPHLCSVYVSGGRNVALKETAWHPADYTEMVGGKNVAFDASKAVDGCTLRGLHDFSCTTTIQSSIWILTLSAPRRVNRYAIYNRDSMRFRLNNVMLESYDAMNSSVFVYKDLLGVAVDIYKIVHSPQPVQMVVVSVNNTEKVLTLCEVEVYGDSICDPQHYGRDCEHLCQCPDNESCFVSTGGCPSGCPAGFRGDTCQDECAVGTYGMGCNGSCSTNCVPSDKVDISSCDSKSGVCHKECQTGFWGALCEKECDVGKFGANCKESCSPNCAPSGQTTVSSCDTKSGVCHKGCQSGFLGNLCTKECDVGKFGVNCKESCSPNCASSGQATVSTCDSKSGVCHKGCQSGFSGNLCTKAEQNGPSNFLLELLIGLAGLLIVVLVLIFCVRRKKPRQPAAEMTTVTATKGDDRSNHQITYSDLEGQLSPVNKS